MSLQQELQEHKEAEMHGHKLGPYIHDIVYGANDGIVTTFAVVSGVAGAQLSPSIVIILGIANVLADALSMGLGNYLSGRSKQDNYQRLLKEEYREIETIPQIEREEIREIYAAKGFTGSDLESVVRVLTANKDIWAKTMMLEEHGLTEEEDGSPVMHAFMTFFSFVIFGCIPIAPYLFPLPNSLHFLVTIVSTAIALLLVGFLRSYVTRERLIKGPLEIVGIGALCALVSYLVGAALRGFAGGVM